MKILLRISELAGRFMALIVLAVAALALFVPQSALWVQTAWINYLLMIVMFGMGLTMKPDDFKVLFTRPKDILIGCAAQFTIMPLLAFLLGKAFALDDALLVGVILVGTCPGGTSSNVITFLSGGDVPLSVGMTSINTLLAPVLTPALTYLLLHTSVQVDVLSMFLSIVQVVIVPIVLGFLITRFFGKYVQKVLGVLSLVSVLAITLIVAAVVSHTAESILSTGAMVFAVVILHNLCGYGCGYALSRALHLPLSKQKTLAIEIGMQNSGLATTLAKTAFAAMPMAAVPGAIFSVWHNISGAILAAVFRRFKVRD